MEYEILIEGEIAVNWQMEFEGFIFSTINPVSGRKYTRMVGTLKDQSALFGILARIGNLNLTLCALRRLK